MLERLFHVRAMGSTRGREALGGLTTFLTMAYILVVNPVFLAAAGIPLAGAVAATCVSAALATLLDAQLEVLPGAGHTPQVTRAGEVAHLIETFVKDVT